MPTDSAMETAIQDLLTETPEKFNQEFKENWMNSRLAHEGVMLEDVQRQQRAAHAVSRFAVHGDKEQLAKDLQDDVQPSEGDAVGVSIGNREIHYHAASSTDTTQQAAATTTSTVAKGIGKIGTAAAIGAAALGGGGLGAVVVSMLSGSDPPAVVQPVEPSPDTDTNAGLRFGPD